jgi:hypothetical protein
MGGLGDFIKGAGGGALGGSTFGPAGTFIGGALGGLAGLFGGGNDADAARKAQMDYFNQLGQQGPAQQAGMSDFRNNQKAYINNLENAAAGRGPSLADAQMRAATDRSTKQASGLAQSGAGNPAAAMMMAQEASGQMGAQNAQMAVGARIDEQDRARQLLGMNLYGARNADEEMNRFNASQSNNFTLDNNRLRGMVLGGAGQNASNVGLSDQILAGGAGMYGAGIGMGPMGRQSRPAPAITQRNGMPGAGFGASGYQHWQNPNFSQA